MSSNQAHRSMAELEQALEECRQRAHEAYAAGDLDAMTMYLKAVASISTELDTIYPERERNAP